MADQIDIQPITTQAGYDACVELDRIVWEDTAVPGHVLRTISHYGGVLLGAFTSGGELVGFVFGFIGQTDDQRRIALSGSPFLHCSHMLGIHPDYRNFGIGQRLKLAQHQQVIEQGHRLAVWTYDPMLGPNAKVNIVHLGAICRHYIPNTYGELPGLYAGLPTDRFEVEWWVGSRYVADHLDGKIPPLRLEELLAEGVQLVNPSDESAAEYRRPGKIAPPQSERLLAEFPGDLNALKAADMALAAEWRYHTRELFESLFDTGYCVTGMLREAGRNYYLLQQDFEALG